MNTISKINRTLSLFVVLTLLSASWLSSAWPVQASANPSPIRYLSGFQTYSLDANDDSSTGVIPIGFTINFFNSQHDTLYVNNNGNVTFDAPQSTYTPYDLTSTSREIVAAFFGDVDTRGTGSSLVTYGNDIVDGHQAFGVNYVNVGYYSGRTDKLNSLQIILIDRSDIGSGNFDIEFNYEKIQWETGDASGGTGGLGGYSARVGFSNGTGTAGTFFELPGSAVNGAFLDTNLITGLIYNSFNGSVPGRYHFEARDGTITISHNPLIFVPGVGGSRMENDPNQDGEYDEVWPNTDALIRPGDDGFLRALKLNSDGTGPFDPNNTEYSTIQVGDIIRTEALQDTYTSTVKFFTEQRGYREGVDFFVCPYDWRKHIPYIATGVLLDNTLDWCINDALAANPGKAQVDILAHSMGGLVARYYVSDANRALKVDHLVTLGTPYLGAPKIAQAAIDKMCFIEPMGICLSNEDTLREIAQNFPSVYEVSPGPSYFQVYAGGYIYRNWDKNGDGANDGWLNLDESYNMLSKRNSGLSAQARSYYSSVGGWSNGGTNGVKVLMVVGSGLASPLILWETQESDWWNPSRKQIVYTIVPSNGDGTVPLNSANMRNPNLGVDLSANVSTVYFNLEHGELAKNTQVLQVASTFFESNQNLASFNNPASSGQNNLPPKDGDKAFVAGSMDSPAAPQQYGPSLDPLPLNGQSLTFNGDVALEVIDQFGNRIGMLDDGGAYEVNIPGASFFPLDYSVSVFLPNDRTYQIFVDGQARTEGLIRIQEYVNDNVEQTTVYEPLLMGESSTASLNFDPNSFAESFSVDQDGDGVVDNQVNVAAVLDNLQSTDLVAPQTAISIEGTPSNNDWYDGPITVTITADDNPGGTGIAKVEYSFDGGQTILDYSGPFIMDASTHRQIMARAIDLAGNSSWQTSAAPVFADVMKTYWSWSFIERLYGAGITGGCSITPMMYCPETYVNRAQMAVFLLRGEHGSTYVPPAVGTDTGFTDVPTTHWAAAWIKQLAAEGITSGCGTGIYCPEDSVTRDQMAIFLLRAEHGSTYAPPAATGVFTDVPTDHWAAAWIEQLAAEGVTSGCGVDTYCPTTPVTRAQMAVFLVRTFNLP